MPFIGVENEPMGHSPCFMGQLLALFKIKIVIFIISLSLHPQPPTHKPLSGHDCSIRLWNMESKTCIQEFTAHRKKFDESINDVAFHPTKCYIGSAGADALAKVFV